MRQVYSYQTKDYVNRFRAFPATDDRTFFLASLWAWKELANR